MSDSSSSQTRRIVTALVASIAVFYLWVFIYNKVQPPTPPAPASTQPAETEPAPATETRPAATMPAEQAALTTRPAGTTSAPELRSTLVVEPATDETPVSLGNAAAGNTYPMALEISPVGAAVIHGWVRGYYETVKKEEPYQVLRPLTLEEAPELDREQYSLATLRVRFDNLNQEVDLDRVTWHKEAAEPDQAVFSVTLRTPEGGALARVVKTYTLLPQPPTKSGKGETYDLGLVTRIENLTDQSLRAVLVQQGPVGFRREQTREDRRVIVAEWEDKENPQIKVKGHFRSEFTGKPLLKLGGDEEDRRIAWAAETNQYFACIMTPADRKGIADPPIFDSLDAIHLTDIKEEFSQDLTFRYTTRPMDIAAGQAREVAFDCYIGPKSKKVLQGTEKYRQRDYYAVITIGFYFCAPAALVSVMMWLLNMFHGIWPHNYGLAIFLLVIVVRAILHPITKKGQVNMMRMQKQMATLKPKIEAAKQKHANDKAALSQATMEIYREAGVNPAGNILSCLPMMLQLPIWGALWTALSSTIEMRHAPLDGWWIKDLTRPDALIPFSTPIHIPLLSGIMGGPMIALNLLPVLLAISQLLQAKYMPRGNPGAATGDNPDQMEQQRKMMMFMSLFFFFMFYNMPSGLNLYIMASNLFGILEQWRIRQHLTEWEEKMKNQPPDAPRKKSWFHRKWEELQKEAEHARQIQSDRPKKTPKKEGRGT